MGGPSPEVTGQINMGTELPATGWEDVRRCCDGSAGCSLLALEALPVLYLNCASLLYSCSSSIVMAPGCAMQEALSKDTYAPMIEAKSIKRAFIGHCAGCLHENNYGLILPY